MIYSTVNCYSVYVADFSALVSCPYTNTINVTDDTKFKRKFNQNQEQTNFPNFPCLYLGSFSLGYKIM